MHYENLVFGATIDSLLFALDKGYPLVYLNTRKPSRLGEDCDKWEKAYFILSLSGLIRFSNKISNARLSERKISLVTHSKTFEITFENLYLFDDIGVSGMPEPIGRTSDEYLVMDWMTITSGSEIACSELLMTPGFVEKINFFQKPKNQNPKYKDLVATSTLTKSQLDSQQYSELFCRFHTEDVLEYTLGKQVRLKSEKREVYPSGRYIYPEMSGVHFPDTPVGREFSSSQPYLKYLLENFEND